MNRLRDHAWAPKYHSDAGALVHQFYVPALLCAKRYDRSTGYFTANALTLAARGVEGLIRNGGRMRLLVGCTLGPAEVEAIEKGTALREAVGNHLVESPIAPADALQADALELVAWMIAQGFLEVKVAVPCGPDRKPITAAGIFHEKAGVVEDDAGDRLAFNGSVNETSKAWGPTPYGNWESFHVFTSFGGGEAHVKEEEASFARLWSDQAKHARVVDVPTAVRNDLLRFLPKNDAIPRRLENAELGANPEAIEETSSKAKSSRPPSSKGQAAEKDGTTCIDIEERRRELWAFLRDAPALPNGGERVGEATAAVVPWPHQVRAFQRMYESWPPKLLIADEVGLGKTIEAGLLLRQAWLSGRAKRILILAPRAVLSQWQIELRDKFNLNWPMYDGSSLRWYPCRALGEHEQRVVGRDEWYKQPFVLASSQLMRRNDRAKELLEAEPWDLIVLDEAHHARRRGAGGTGKDKGPNQLLKLMQALQSRTQGLVLLTATPMQVHPVEVWDLLNLLGLPPTWSPELFVKFFQLVGQPNPSHEDFEFLAAMFRATEEHFGSVAVDTIKRWVNGSQLAAKKVLEALRDNAQNPRRQLAVERRRAALHIMRANTPVSRLVSRHTRELLRRYHAAGKLSSRIAERQVDDAFVPMTPDERKVYERVESYISSTYDNASEKERNAVGFVMTIYRRRLASSFAALASTLADRFAAVGRGRKSKSAANATADDVSDDEMRDEAMDVDEATQLAQQALVAEESADIQALLRDVRALPTDTKARHLLEWIKVLRAGGYPQAIVFTQYTDTMDFLREFLRKNGIVVMCYSGRGGEISETSGAWRAASRDDAKRWFRDGKADVLLATDAAAEGLNFQFCGALVNYDMPWNPMRVEQRIGRIDRLGQAFERIRIVNLHYEDTIETDVYTALRTRIGLFSTVIGKLQPILAALPRQFAEAALTGSETRPLERAALVSRLESDIQARSGDAFDLDEVASADLDEPERPAPLYSLDTLDEVLRDAKLLPPGIEAKPLAQREYEYAMPGLSEPLRVTTSRELFEDHPATYELWSPGSPLFPVGK